MNEFSKVAEYKVNCMSVAIKFQVKIQKAVLYEIAHTQTQNNKQANHELFKYKFNHIYTGPVRQKFQNIAKRN